MIELPGKVRVLRFRYEELKEFRREARNAAEWGVDFFGQYLKEEYPDWYVYARVYDDSTEHYYVILTENAIPVLSTVEYDEGGEPYIKESIVQ